MTKIYGNFLFLCLQCLHHKLLQLVGWCVTLLTAHTQQQVACFLKPLFQAGIGPWQLPWKICWWIHFIVDSHGLKKCCCFFCLPEKHTKTKRSRDNVLSSLGAFNLSMTFRYRISQPVPSPAAGWLVSAGEAAASIDLGKQMHTSPQQLVF